MNPNTMFRGANGSFQFQSQEFQFDRVVNIAKRVQSIRSNAGGAISDSEMVSAAWHALNPDSSAQSIANETQSGSKTLQPDALAFHPSSLSCAPRIPPIQARISPIQENEEIARVPVSPSSYSVTSVSSESSVASATTVSSVASVTSSTSPSNVFFPSPASVSPPNMNLNWNLGLDSAIQYVQSAAAPQAAITPNFHVYYPPFAYPGVVLLPANGVFVQMQQGQQPYMPMQQQYQPGMWANVSGTGTGNYSNVIAHNNTAAQPASLGVTPTLFMPDPKKNNVAKGNFYISKDMIQRLMKEAAESFTTGGGNEEDEKLTFAYYKESTALQINDGELYIFSTAYGEMIPINIDLHFKQNGRAMYLVATVNDEPFKSKVKWQISALMTSDEICGKYGEEIRSCLPASSRQKPWFTQGMSQPPTNLNVQRLNFKDLKNLKCKSSKRKNDDEATAKSERKNVQKVSTWALKTAIKRSFGDDDVPVVVIKGKQQWVEWKRLVCIPEITDEFGRPGVIAISLWFDPQRHSWQMQCIDCDAGRVYYQHRLCALDAGSRYHRKYSELINRITVSSLKVQKNNKY